MKELKVIIVIAVLSTLLSFGMASIAFSAKARPDLSMQSIGDLTASVARGGSFTITDTVANNGNKKAGVFTIRYYLSLDSIKNKEDILLARSRRVKSLNYQGTSSDTVNLTVPKKTPLNQYYLIACADNTKKIKESNEKNNCTASQTMMEVRNPVVAINIASYANLSGRWEYKWTVLPDTINTWAVEVLGIISKNEKNVFLLQEYSEQGHENDKDYLLTDMSQGLFRVGGANHVPDSEDEEFFYQSEMPYLLSVFVPGQEYTYNFTRTDFEGTLTHTVKIEKESVTVPAGTYTDCYKSTVTVPVGEFIYIDIRWYAKNVGLVKRIQSNNGSIWELTSYIP